MNQDALQNPPTDIGGIDPQLLQTMATKLAEWRDSPPTISSIVCQWRRTPLLLIVGTILTSIVAWLVTWPDSPVTSHWVIGFASVFFGGALRDLGWGRSVTRSWSAQSFFMDWEKIHKFRG